MALLNGLNQWGFGLNIPDFECIVREAQELNFPILESISARMLYFLCLLHKPNRILELGTGLGYSTRHMAAALSGGTFYLCDHRQDLLNRVAAELPTFECHLMAGPVSKTLDGLDETFDLIFLDIDKRDYLDTFRLSWPKLRAGGLMIVDNIFFGGEVFVQNTKKKQGVLSIREMLLEAQQFPACLMPVGDGLLVLKKPD